MAEIFYAFLSWQFLFFCVAIGAIVFMIRRLVEYAMDHWWPLKKWSAAHKDQKLWRGLILPVMPILLGQMIALLITKYPYPVELSSAGGRWLFGLVAGFSSGLIVKMYKELLSGQISELAVKVVELLKSIKPAEKTEKEKEESANE